MIYHVITATGCKQDRYSEDVIGTFCFSQIVREDATPIDCARKRASELYPNTDNHLSTIVLTVEEERDSGKNRILSKRDLTALL